MNLLHLKYALEVAKTSSINKASENLFMNQPNLSRAIKDLEENLGISLFNRTSKGISVTEEGAKFLVYARSIVNQVDEIENIYKNNGKKKSLFSVSVPRASYISRAFVNFSKKAEKKSQIEFYYKETNAYRTIDNVTRGDYKIGIIRYNTVFEEHFKLLLANKGLNHEVLSEFSHKVIISKNNELANKAYISHRDLSNFIEIAHPDPYAPFIPISKVKEEEYSSLIDKRIFVFERGSQYDLLQDLPNTFIWASPVPLDTLEKYNLVQIPCDVEDSLYKDVLIKEKNYSLSELDKLFLDELFATRDKYF
ncbi:MAG: LysR family transcriptional regulator [Lachnospirales bacterium]